MRYEVSFTEGAVYTDSVETAKAAALRLSGGFHMCWVWDNEGRTRDEAPVFTARDGKAWTGLLAR